MKVGDLIRLKMLPRKMHYKESIVHDFTFPELDKNVIADGYHPNKNLYEQFAETLAGAI